MSVQVDIKPQLDDSAGLKSVADLSIGTSEHHSTALKSGISAMSTPIESSNIQKKTLEEPMNLDNDTRSKTASPAITPKSGIAAIDGTRQLKTSSKKPPLKVPQGTKASKRSKSGAPIKSAETTPFTDVSVGPPGSPTLTSRPLNEGFPDASKTLSPNAGTSLSLQTVSAKDEPAKDEPVEPAKPRKEKYEAKLFNDLPDATMDATSTFEIIENCIYSNKTIGDSGQSEDQMQCECKPQFDGDENHACDDDSDCINRLTLMECTPDGCGCHSDCKNQRFQKRFYAKVSVFKTAQKGYGLRADVDIHKDEFIYEYVGEVIDEPRFRQRNAKYAQSGVKHFYFMSLEKDQFIDATKRGGLARFVNHSCNPNCETQKWVVGGKYRMGIFAKRGIKRGEELVFDYNVDRYGAEKSPCYCGEPNCLGYIGGKTQTDAAPTKLSENLIAALGIEDDKDFTIKKPRRGKKTSEHDEEYLGDVVAKPLDVKGVPKVMGTLAATKEKWIAIKLLSRIEHSDDPAVFASVLRFHAYGIIGKFLALYKDDDNIALSIFTIFQRFPMLTKNKINAAGVEPIVEELSHSSNEELRSKALKLLAEWEMLETSYRIPRRLREDQSDPTAAFLDRSRDSRSTSKTESPKRSPGRSAEPIPPWLVAKNKPTFTKQPPKGPRADRERFGNRPHGFGGNRHAKTFLQRKLSENSLSGNVNPENQSTNRSLDLPLGWHRCFKPNGCYYYSNDGKSSWTVPTVPCFAWGPPKTIPPPPVPKSDLQAVIDDIKLRRAHAVKLEEERKKQEEEEKERERQERRAKRKEKVQKVYDVEKTRRYLSLAFRKFVPNMVNKHRKDLGTTPESSKESVKRHAKEIVALLVDKEMRYHKDRVANPLHVCTESKVAKMKVFVDEYCRKLIQRRKASQGGEKSASPVNSGVSTAGSSGSPVESNESPTAYVRSPGFSPEERSFFPGEKQKRDRGDEKQSKSPFDSRNAPSVKRKRDDMEYEMQTGEGKRLKSPPPNPQDVHIEVVSTPIAFASETTPKKRSFEEEIVEDEAVNGEWTNSKRRRSV